MEYSFPRYLAAKRSVDDRALNRQVWLRMVEALDALEKAPNVLEVGAGTGTMFQRMLEWGALSKGEYRGIDLLVENVAAACAEIPPWAVRRGLRVTPLPEIGFHLAGNAIDLRLTFEQIDLFDWMQREAGRHKCDLLIAHAFLDLFDIPRLMPELAEQVSPGGLLYFTINFDGQTIFEPVWDAELEEGIISAYHRSMDERLTDGRRSGDSRAGRHLFEVLGSNGLEILAAGSSDWVVYPQNVRYPADEAYFLHHILHFFEESLHDRSEISADVLQAWLQRRHAQVERGELVYLAHQLDFLVRRPFLR